LTPKVYCSIHKRPPSVPIPSQMSPVHNTPILLLEDPFHIVLPITPRSAKWSLSLRFPHQNPVGSYPVSHTRHMLRPSGSSSFDHPYTILWAVQIIKFLNLLSSPLLCNLVPFRFIYLPQQLISPIHINTIILCIYIHIYMITCHLRITLFYFSGYLKSVTKFFYGNQQITSDLWVVRTRTEVACRHGVVFWLWDPTEEGVIKNWRK